MKKLNVFMGVFLSLSLSKVAFAEQTPAAASSSPQIQDCPSANEEIRNFCSQNPSLAQAQSQMSQAGTMSNSGIGTNADDGQTYARQSQSAIRQAQAQCQEAFTQCERVCGQQQVDANRANNTALANQAVNIRNLCRQEKATMDTKSAAMQANLSEILQAIAAMMQALGLGQGSGGAINASVEEPGDEDPCEGEYADLLIECQGQSDPSGTRASLSGVGSLNGRTSGGLGNGLLDGAQSGEPGGEDKGVGKDNGGGSPFGAAGVAGGSGLGGTNAGAAGGSGGKEGFDTDINKGFMGTGGFGDGGGGGGGGGSSGGGGRYASLNPMGSGLDGMNKAALQKQLNKYTNNGGRSPASEGGANGPFDDNWAIINKAYKKNSGSMFHQ